MDLLTLACLTPTLSFRIGNNALYINKISPSLSVEGDGGITVNLRSLKKDLQTGSLKANGFNC
jgi:hypothetical protein